MSAESNVAGMGGGRFLRLAALMVLLHAGFVVYRYGQLPISLVLGDEVIINDASVSLARGHGCPALSKRAVDQTFLRGFSRG